MTTLGTLLKRAGTAALLAGLSLTSVNAETYLPNCYIPAEGNEKIIQYEAKEGPYRIALVNGHTGIPWREQMIQSVRAWANRAENKETIGELRVVSTGPDVATQIAAVDNFIQAGYDAIVFIAVNPTAFDAVVRRANRAGTVLVSFDNPVDNDSILRITPNWVDFETIKAKSVLAQMPDKTGRILEIRGIQGNSTDRDRHVGVEQVLADYPNVDVVEVVGNWDTGTVQRVTADAFAVHGQFDGIICQHGCRGVTNAMAAADHPAVPVGGDAENGYVKAMAGNGIPGISVSVSPGMGPLAVRAAVALLQGEAFPSMANLPIPNVETADMVAGVHYYPDEPDTFETVTGYATCGADMVFTPDELRKQSYAND
ncbi:sugar ABC transporter substrate-binding protein [Mameliella sediminis]|uniref:sugar ABC transporter substrate-binding protein n=1 Tax=Mameliella sediminis TaxID=2836866 RepID=UPI001C46B164|nr:sugar ABC transporter substrate-binding protein [Mameliella sediminis]MBY6114079.1 ABC transporter substrate-binding protein [Antarctobacter heliothermus]MBY6142573.1 ABC transporter substrate-binding protein [Mameliella alba]MBV7395376.1 ABC transporter substrate-binding protein [Mameliella sediminis]MBY6159401.1 ABC transporter substrate-binding protein [Mameliella alba]MBY6167872.1 ABC transporter substrate-binding protein [Mameliella alba]